MVIFFCIWVFFGFKRLPGGFKRCQALGRWQVCGVRFDYVVFTFVWFGFFFFFPWVSPMVICIQALQALA